MASASPLRLRLLDVLIVGFWAYLLIDAWIQGRELPALIAQIGAPPVSGWPLALLFVAAVGLVAAGAWLAYRQRSHIMDDLPIITRVVDRVFGVGAYSYFTHRIRPASTSVASSALFGAVGLFATGEDNPWSQVVCFGSLAFGVLMTVACLVSRRFPPVLR